MKAVYVLAVVAVIGMVAIAGCGDDKSTNSESGALLGSWLLVSGEIESQPIMVPSDTIIFRANRTGHYGSEVGFGWYDFSYGTQGGTCVITRTAGQYSGQADTAQFQVQGTTLRLSYDSTVTLGRRSHTFRRL